MLELEQQLYDIQNRRSSALKGLSLLTGKTLDEKVTLTAPVVSSVSKITIDRPEIHYLDAQQQAMTVSEQLIKTKNQPKVNAFATGGYGRPGLNFLTRDFSFYAQIGAQVKVPLTHYYSKSTSLEMQQIAVNKKKLEQLKNNILLATEVRLSAQEQEAVRLESLIETDNKIIELREKIRKIAEIQWENGVISGSEYIIELNNEDVARQNKIVHEVQLLQARFIQTIIAGH